MSVAVSVTVNVVVAFGGSVPLAGAMETRGTDAEEKEGEEEASSAAFAPLTTTPRFLRDCASHT